MASTAESVAPGGHGHEDGETRRDFLMLATGAVGAVSVGAALWPLIDQMNPAADTLAASTTEVNLAPLKEGQRIVVKWRGKPIFITHRTPETVKEMEAVPMSQLVDPETDQARVQKAAWLIIIGICTHLGCVPEGSKKGQPRGDYGGWFCPCHGSQYDESGRIRSGPAPKNMHVPDYAFLPDNKVVIGLKPSDVKKSKS